MLSFSNIQTVRRHFNLVFVIFMLEKCPDDGLQNEAIYHIFLSKFSLILKGLISLSCTDVGCYWNSTSKKDIGPSRIKDMKLQAYKLGRPTSSHSLNGTLEQDFDARPLPMRNISEEDKQIFLVSVRKSLPDAVFNITYSPPSGEDVPPPTLKE